MARLFHSSSLAHACFGPRFGRAARLVLGIGLAIVALAGCGPRSATDTASSHKLSVAEFTGAGDGRAAFAHAAPKRPEQVRLFLESVDQQLRTLSVAAMEADWAKSTNITDETEERAAQANEVLMAYLSEAIRVAATYRDVSVLNASDARKLELLRRGSSLPAPQNPAHREELSAIASRMESL
ncbi:MAG: Peptidyl-dipeptidase precursor, partial [Myxococcaceae bacterium]|nr:Peptidyl-dipeptidase precursor [Myxococcaceae bacterium]